MSGRILFLAPQPYFRLRGMCLAQKECLAELARLGHEVEVLCPPGGSNPSAARVTVRRLPPLPFVDDVPIGFSWAKVAYGALMIPAAARLLARRRFEAVHACEEAVFVGALLKPFFGFRLVYDMDDVLSRRLEASGVARSRLLLGFLRAVQRWMLRAADAVVTNSAETLAFARAVAGPGKVSFYDHTPPLQRPLGGGSARARRRVRAALGLGERPIALYAGNLERYQGVELLLEAFARVVARNPQAALVIVGGQPIQIEALRRRALALGLGSAVRFLGQRPLRSALGLMRAADALVSPMTEVKAVPMKLYAYLSAGRPIVATALPNHEQILTGGTALLVPPRPDALADSLCRVFENPELARRLSSATRGLADERIDARDCGEALALAYAKVRAPAKERELPARSSRSAPRSALLQESL